MELSGKIHAIQPTKVISDKFKSRNVVVVTDEQYPQHIEVQFVNDKCDILDKYAQGQQVKISINIRGREWVNPQGETKYFNTIQGWRIEALSEAPKEHKGQSVYPPQQAAPKAEVPADDGLPF